MERRLAAILVADVVGYSRLMGEDEAGTLAALNTHRKEVFDPKIAEHKGHVVKLMGDGALVEFPSVVEATQCAVEIQRAVALRNAVVPGERRIEFRIGINLGDIIVEGNDIYGDGVNVAARLQEIAQPGGICIRHEVREQVRGKLSLAFEDIGEVEAKNIARPVHVWRWTEEPRQAASEPLAVPDLLPIPDKPSIAVLPFDNMSGDPEQEYFSDGISEDIITTLSKVPRLFVIARNSTFVYKGRAVDVKQVAADQGVSYVLEGSVRKVGNRVRITGQLVDALSGHHLWAEHYDGHLDDVFSLQDEITQEIVSALEVKLTDGEQARVWRKRAGDPRVYERFQRGWALYNQFTKRSNAQAREELEAAVELNPSFAKAYLALGHTYADQMRWGWSANPDRTLQTAYELVTTALDLDPDFPDALATLGYIHLLNRSYDAAIAQAEKALALGPSSADTHHVTAIIYNYSGLPQDGASVAKQAVRLSPMAYNNFLTELGHAHCLLGQYDKAISLLLNVLAETPFWRTARALLIFALFELGKVDKAREEAAKLLGSAPRFSLKAWARYHPYRHQADLEHYIGALREAGLPE